MAGHLIAMKLIHLTFIYQDMDNNTSHIMQFRTQRRTLEEAWEDAVSYIYKYRGIQKVWSGEQRFVMVHAFEGLCNPVDDSKPFRRPTPEEIKEMEKIIDAGRGANTSRDALDG